MTNYIIISIIIIIIIAAAYPEGSQKQDENVSITWIEYKKTTDMLLQT